MRNVLIVTLAFAAIVILVLSDFGRHGTRVYDCGMAEWHPDIPNAVKEECRRIHYEEWKRQQEEKNKTKLITT